MKGKATDNMVRAKVAGEFRGLVPSLSAGDPVRLSNGNIVTYASHSTTYGGGGHASVSVRCYPFDGKALQRKEPVEIPASFRSVFLGSDVPVGTSVVEKPAVAQPLYRW